MGQVRGTQIDGFDVFPCELPHYEHQIRGLGGHLQSENRPTETPKTLYKPYMGSFPIINGVQRAYSCSLNQ